MKYIENNKMYVQLIDLRFVFMHGITSPPKSVFDKALHRAVHMSDDDKYEYLEFDLPEEIKYFNSLSFILDYSVVKDLSKEELYEYIIATEEDIAHIKSLYQNAFKYVDYVVLNNESEKEYHKYETLKYLYKRKEKEEIKVKSLKPSTLNK